MAQEPLCDSYSVIKSGKRSFDCSKWHKSMFDSYFAKKTAREAVPLTSCPGEGLPNAESGNRLCWSPPGRSPTPNPAALGSLQPVPTQCTNSVTEIKFVTNGE